MSVYLIYDTGLDTGIYKIHLFTEALRPGSNNLGTTVSHQTFTLERGIG